MAQLDLNNFKTQIKSILDTANTTTASVDLSNNLTDRVAKVLKYNIERIPIQASFFPAVTVFMDNKAINTETIAKNQATSVRRAVVTMKIAGVMWNANLTSDLEDPADEDLESLMENIEEILRNNETLNNVCTWSYPTSVEYFSGIPDEETHLRIGVMNLEMSVFY